MLPPTPTPLFCALTVRAPLQRPIGLHTWVAHVVKVAIGRHGRSCNAWISYMRSDRRAQKIGSNDPNSDIVSTEMRGVGGNINVDRFGRARCYRPPICGASNGSVRLKCRHQQFVCPNIFQLATVEQVVRMHRAFPPLSFSVRSSGVTAMQSREGL